MVVSKTKPYKTKSKGKKCNQKEIVYKTLLNRRVDGTTLRNQVQSTSPIYFYNLLTGIAKGTDKGDRINNEIILTGFKFIRHCHNGSNLQALKIRTIIAVTRNPNQDIHEDLFAPCSNSTTPRDYDLSGTATDRHLYYLYPLNTQKFSQIFYDKVHDIPIDDVTITGTNQNIVDIKAFVKLPNIKCRFNNSGTATESVYPNIRMYHFFVDKNGTPSNTCNVDEDYYTYFLS